MRTRYALVLVLAVVLVGMLVFRPRDTERGTSGDTPTTATTLPSHEPAAPTAESISSKAPKVTRKRTQVTKEERERYRAAIRRAIDNRTPPPDRSSDDVEDPTPRVDENDSAREPLKDRSNGKLARLMKDFQSDVMPLADECYTQALERDPSVAGGLDMQFQIIGDEDVGGLVESVELEDSSEIRDDEMIECIRETLLSTIFPAPDDSGAAGVRLTLRFSPDE